MEINWKQETKINRGFFREPRKLWIMIAKDPHVIRHHQFRTRTEANMWARANNVSDYILHMRNRRSIPAPWAFLDKEKTYANNRKIEKIDLPHINPFGELICCVGCGRDTKSKRGYCPDCLPKNLYVD